MRLILLTSLTMMAFAANSILNRAAIDTGSIDPSSFAVIRVLAGAVALGMILTVRGGGLPILARARAVGGLGLATYMIGFSLAYVTLDAGLGALILFGTVQTGMFAWTAIRGAPPTLRALAGAGVAFAGLMLALWPRGGAQASDLGGALLMVAAGLGWVAYTFSGRGATDPVAATAANFVVALPLMLVLMIGADVRAMPSGILLAIVSGAITSGLGYTLWYHVLPQMAAQTAAVVQLSVPVIAIAAGVLFLGEAVGPVLILSAAMVLGGIAVAVTSPRPRADRN